MLEHAEVLCRNSYVDMLPMQAGLAHGALSYAAWRAHAALRKYFAAFHKHTFFVKTEPSSVLPLFVRHGICAVSGSVKYPPRSSDGRPGGAGCLHLPEAGGAIEPGDGKLMKKIKFFIFLLQK